MRNLIAFGILISTHTNSLCCSAISSYKIKRDRSTFQNSSERYISGVAFIHVSSFGCLLFSPSAAMADCLLPHWRSHGHHAAVLPCHHAAIPPYRCAACHCHVMESLGQHTPSLLQQVLPDVNVETLVSHPPLNLITPA